ncbi:O-acetyltransferase OatA [Porphyridium purpureum]|uniref:O-acetyltransferase OatA n=1 Tax=Porphyridium purpureum TaxID=35688 RepID=A0A5J4Z6R2_PORPP|nr:O-acetyltransferase OatA [Porphyridium purpureum]|eukprot:POR1806..scf295_1
MANRWTAQYHGALLVVYESDEASDGLIGSSVSSEMLGSPAHRSPAPSVPGIDQDSSTSDTHDHHKVDLDISDKLIHMEDGYKFVPRDIESGADLKPTNAYLEHLDGLRAVALLVVLLFHFNLQMPGGFLGVDLFFVLSGFLISRNMYATLLCPEKAGSEASARAEWGIFYTRRFWRLYPSALFTVAWTAVWALTQMPRTWVQAYADSAIGSLLSMSNFVFLSEAGYWDASAATKPLLHTWSLSVEEQFYIFWPALLMVLTYLALHLRRKDPSFPNAPDVTRFRRASSIAVIGVVSLVSSQLMYGRHTSAVFFLTPFRVWEFCVGAILVDMYPWISQWSCWILVELLSATGLAAVLCSAVFVDENMLAEWNAVVMLPCVLGGAVLIVSPQSWLCSRVLSHPALRFVGKVSYSVYLVHWPLRTVFDSYNFMHRERDLSVSPILLGLGLCAVSLILGTLQYEMIEKRLRLPSRSGLAVGRARVSAMVCSVLVTVGLVIAARFDLKAKARWDSETGTDIVAMANEVGIARSGKEDLVSMTQPCAIRTAAGQHKDSLSNAIARSCMTYPIELPVRSAHSLYCYGITRGSHEDCPLGAVEHGSRSKAVFVGDSMMLAFRPALHNIGIHLNTSFMMIAWSGCRAELFKQHPRGSKCEEVFTRTKKRLAAMEPSVIFFTEYMDAWCTRQGLCRLPHEKTFRWLQDLGHRVVVIMNPPEAPERIYQRMKNHGAHRGPYSFRMEENLYRDSAAKRDLLLNSNLGVFVIDLLPAFRVSHNVTRAFADAGDEFALRVFGDQPVFGGDSHHLSLAGAIAVAPYLEQAILKELNAFQADTSHQSAVHSSRHTS